MTDRQMETRPDTAQTMASSDSCRLSRQLQTVKTVADCQDSCRLSRQLHTVKTVAHCQDSCRLSRQLQTIKTTAYCQDSCRQLLTVADISALVRPCGIPGTDRVATPGSGVTSPILFIQNQTLTQMISQDHRNCTGDKVDILAFVNGHSTNDNVQNTPRVGMVKRALVINKQIQLDCYHCLDQGAWDMAIMPIPPHPCQGHRTGKIQHNIPNWTSSTWKEKHTKHKIMTGKLTH